MFKHNVCDTWEGAQMHIAHVILQRADAEHFHFSLIKAERTDFKVKN